MTLKVIYSIARAFTLAERAKKLQTQVNKWGICFKIKIRPMAHNNPLITLEGKNPEINPILNILRTI